MGILFSEVPVYVYKKRFHRSKPVRGATARCAKLFRALNAIFGFRESPYFPLKINVPLTFLLFSLWFPY